MRLSQDEPGLASLRSVDESLSEVHGLRIPCRLTELSRDATSVLPVVGRISGWTVFLRSREVDSRRSILSASAEVVLTG